MLSASKSYDDLFLNRMAEKVEKQECVLFLGSAIHAPSTKGPCKYPKGLGPPIGNELSRLLAHQTRYARVFPRQDKTNLLRTSQHYESTFSRHSLIEEIEKQIHRGKEPSPALRALALLNFPLVITTNYDQLYERTLEELIAARRVEATDYTVSIYSPDKNAPTVPCPPLNKLTSRNPFILKIHGDISQPASIVITDEDYIKFIMRMGDRDGQDPVGNNVRAHLMKWPTLFIGYSLKDYNLRVLFRTLRRELAPGQLYPTAYSIDFRPDNLILDVWETQNRFVKFLVEDIWDFVPKLYLKVKKEPMPC